MLDELFMSILDLTKTGSIVILAVIAVRFFLKKAPKVISYALWAVVLFRLLCPVTLELPVSMMPNFFFMAQSLFLCDASFLTYSLLLASMILRKKYSSSG